MSGSEERGVAVVIVLWNAAEFIEDCLASLAAQSRPPAEIVIVDNASNDDGVERARRACPSATLIRSAGNVGFCAANNLGIARSSSPFVLVLNPDTKLEPDFLERLLPAFGDSRVGIACGKLLRFDGRTLDSAGQELARSRQPHDRGYGRPDEGQYDRDATTFGACGAAVVYRRAMLEAVADPDDGYFDERFFAYYEDLDLAWRARRAGWTSAYRHAAVGYHARGGSGGRNPLYRRFAALLNRPAEIRYHIVKNRYLTILRNDRLRDYLRDLPWIAARDASLLLLLGLTSPSVLPRLWRARGLFAEALRRGRLDAARMRD